MRLPSVEAPPAAPSWPPILVTRGPGQRSVRHAHHGVHLVYATRGRLTVRVRSGPAIETAGIVTAPDVAHEIDARGVEVVLVFADPESTAGASLVPDGGARTISDAERDRIPDVADPRALMAGPADRWLRATLEGLGIDAVRTPKVDLRVKRALRAMRATTSERTALATLAADAKLSPSRFLHLFTASVGIPLRPYLAWLRLQRAAALVTTGVPLARAAQESGYADAAHMTRSFRRMLGLPPSQLRPA